MITVETLEDEIKPPHEPKREEMVSDYKPLTRENIVELSYYCTRT